MIAGLGAAVEKLFLEDAGVFVGFSTTYQATVIAWYLARAQGSGRLYCGRRGADFSAPAYILAAACVELPIAPFCGAGTHQVPKWRRLRSLTAL